MSSSVPNMSPSGQCQQSDENRPRGRRSHRTRAILWLPCFMTVAIGTPKSLAFQSSLETVGKRTGLRLGTSSRPSLLMGCTRELVRRTSSIKDQTDSQNEQTIDNNLSTDSDLIEFSIPEPIKEETSPQEFQAEARLSVPSVGRILSFAIPAIGIWLAGPLLSMIDTSAVGLYSGTAQQAALNPAVAVTDYSARTLSFLYTGTTNMMAIAKDTDKSGTGAGNQTSASKDAFRGALQLSVLVGAALGAFLFAFASPMVHGLIGNDAIGSDVTAAAIRYVRIRSLGIPASAVIGTAQAGCLGLQDVKSPLYVIGVAATLNFFLDLLLVGRPQKWVGGTAGAAWATILSQYVAMSLFLKWLAGRRQPTYAMGSTVETLKTEEGKSFSARGFLSGRLGWKKFFRSKPNNQTIDGFKPYVIPVTTTQIGRCSTYVALGYVVSSTFGTTSMAANQIITSIFYSLIPIADSLSLTAQSFIPSLLSKSDHPDSRKQASIAMKLMTKNMLKVAGIFGGVLASIVACIPFACRFFTADPAVTNLVTRVVPILVTIFSLHGVFCGAEGILLAQRDLKFLGRMYAGYFVVVPWLMLQIKSAAQAGRAVDLLSVWQLFLAYQLFRITAWTSRVVWLQRCRDAKAANTDPPPILD